MSLNKGVSMKKTLLTLGLSLASLATTANCIPAYGDQRVLLITKVNALQLKNKKQADVNNMAIVSGLTTFGTIVSNPVEFATLISSNPAVAVANSVEIESVAMFGGASIGYEVGSSIYKGIAPEEEAALIKEENDVTASLTLLKEAEVGDGQVIQNLMKEVWAEAGQNISVKDVADAILKLNNENSFCLDNRLDNAHRIFLKTLNIFRRENNENKPVKKGE